MVSQRVDTTEWLNWTEAFLGPGWLDAGLWASNFTTVSPWSSPSTLLLERCLLKLLVGNWVCNCLYDSLTWMAVCVDYLAFFLCLEFLITWNWVPRRGRPDGQAPVCSWFMKSVLIKPVLMSHWPTCHVAKPSISVGEKYTDFAYFKFLFVFL